MASLSAYRERPDDSECLGTQGLTTNAPSDHASPADSSDDSEIVLVVDAANYARVLADLFTVRSLRSTQNPAMTDRGGAGMITELDIQREKHRRRLVNCGYRQRYVDRFVARPCIARADDLLRSRLEDVDTRTNGNARMSQYKESRLYKSDSANRNWILLDPSRPNQLYASLIPTILALEEGERAKIMWKAPQEARFVQMLEYAFYRPQSAFPTTIDLTTDDEKADTPMDAAPETTTSAARVRKHRPNNPPPRASQVSHTPPRPPSSSSSQTAIPSAPARSIRNPADRYLEYNTLTHAVRSRSSFQSRFGKRMVVYTALGPRFADAPGPDLEGTGGPPPPPPPPPNGARAGVSRSAVDKGDKGQRKDGRVIGKDATAGGEDDDDDDEAEAGRATAATEGEDGTDESMPIAERRVRRHSRKTVKWEPDLAPARAAKSAKRRTVVAETIAVLADHDGEQGEDDETEDGGGGGDGGDVGRGTGRARATAAGRKAPMRGWFEEDVGGGIGGGGGGSGRAVKGVLGRVVGGGGEGEVEVEVEVLGVPDTESDGSSSDLTEMETDDVVSPVKQ